MILAGGFVQWIFDSMREGTIRSQLGHIQIVRPGFYEKGLANPYAYLLKQDDPVFKQISETPGVLTVAPRLIFSGLVSHGDSTISFAGDGIDPAKEKELSTYVQIVDGQPLSPDDPTGIIIGQGLAANLGVSTGDTIVLLAATQKGSLNAVECKVRGLFVTAAKAYDDAFLRAPLQVAQKLARTKGVTSWLVLLSETDHTDAFLNTIKAQVSRDDLEFIPWHALADFYNKTVALMSRQVGSIEILIAFIIILSISNTLVHDGHGKNRRNRDDNGTWRKGEQRSQAFLAGRAVIGHPGWGYRHDHRGRSRQHHFLLRNPDASSSRHDHRSDGAHPHSTAPFI